MQNVPQIVRERLRTAAPSVSHPEADMLTAFAEQSLPSLERDIVLEHLARCGDCREVVALSLPVAEPTQGVLRPSSTGWLTWPALRWGVVAMGVVAVASFGIVQYRIGQYKGRVQSEPIASRQSAPVKMAENDSKQQPLVNFAAPSDAENSKKLLPPAASGAAGLFDKATAVDSDEKVSARRETAPARISAAQPATGAVGGSVVGPIRGRAGFGPSVANNQFQQNSNALQNQSAPAPPPTSYAKQRPVVDDQSANARVPSVNETVAVAGAEVSASTETSSLDAAPSNELRVGKAKPPLDVKAENAPSAPGAPVPSQPLNGRNVTQLVMLSGSAPAWTITASGRLQRSVDQGKTWEDVDVDVNANPQAFVDSGSLGVAAQTSRAKEKDSRKAVKQETAAFTFRSVAASGSEVWAGGSASALYHSVDAGNHWSRVVPASAGTSLAGDVISIEFPDTAHGKISTSTSEIWTTGDAGQTWQKQ